MNNAVHQVRRKGKHQGGYGATSHPFRRGDTRDYSLPKRRGRDVRIPRDLVNAEWLKENKHQDLPKFVGTDEQEEDEGEGGGEGEEDEDEEGQEENESEQEEAT